MYRIFADIFIPGANSRFPRTMPILLAVGVAAVVVLVFGCSFMLLKRHLVRKQSPMRSVSTFLVVSIKRFCMKLI